jgi:hypothetical protein
LLQFTSLSEKVLRGSSALIL